jgi:hypothetical protein
MLHLLHAAPLVLILAASLAAVGCTGETPSAPAPGPAGPLPQAHGRGLPWPAGAWTWSWQALDGSGRGVARLQVTDRRWAWDLGPAPPAGALVLSPPDGTWETMRIADGAEPDDWLPLPRVPTMAGGGSAAELAALLTAPRFGSRTTHWPSLPIPVRTGRATAGQLDLSACLRTAMDRWNLGAEPPWFAASDSAAWGVRLVHLAGRTLSPPFWAQITRLDGGGRPLGVSIVAGDNLAAAGDSIYAVRAFVHELGHALFLWGHSPCREHVLWGAAPPIVGWPSPDERKAAQLVHGLPEGLDLSRYGSASGP